MNKSGSCLCGAITYETSGALRPVVACHCAQCRKTSGNYVTATSVARDRITIKGEPVWFASSDTARRGFCGTCGSNLFWDGAGKNISIFAGTIDGESGLKLKGHIFCADKGDYYDIADGLPRAEQADADLTTKVE
ncbi:GFA family protein [uncultured Litoreibacter sp.]|uniref:GFA family protein n=1 Tax=uncultured Litoreibacter sp. TaxID=1392394 RepID=UPI002621A4C3|nr:GFA family protein [uncultured Litoreibacter sp.]